MAKLDADYTVVGCGPGAREYLTSSAAACIARAQLLAGASRLLDQFPESRACKAPYSGRPESFLDRLEAMPARPCVILVSGDPGISSLALSARRRFGAARCHIEPGVSSIQFACACLGLSWQNAAIVDVHGCKPSQVLVPPDSCDPWLFLMGAPGGEAWVAGVAERRERPLIVAEDLSLPTQSLTTMTPAELARLSPHPRRLVIMSNKALAHD